MALLEVVTLVVTSVKCLDKAARHELEPVLAAPSRLRPPLVVVDVVTVVTVVPLNPG